MCIVLPPGFRIAVNIAGCDFERPGTDDPKLPFPARGSGPWMHNSLRPPDRYIRRQHDAAYGVWARGLSATAGDPRRSSWGAHDQTGHAQREGRSDRALTGPQRRGSDCARQNREDSLRSVRAASIAGFLRERLGQLEN